jgi:hypothetical protein
METNTREPAAAALRAESTAAADRFLTTLRREQARYLAAVEEARAQLEQDDGQLAHVAAIQGRMSRQFFDAQRSILRRRADADAEVARIEAQTAASARSLVDTAHGLALQGRNDVAVLGLPESTFETSATPTWRDEVAALGVSVVRSNADVAEIRAIVDDAFRSADPDGIATERELRRVLDDWWRLTSQECTALVDDANARAAVRLHLAGLEARHIVEHTLVAEPAAVVDTPQPFEHVGGATEVDEVVAVDVPDIVEMIDVDSVEGHLADPGHDAGSPFAPPDGPAVIDIAAPEPHIDVVPVIAALDAADQSGLDGVLDELLQSFEVPVVPVLAPAPIDLRIREEAELPPQEAFRRFWEQGVAPAPTGSRNSWSPTRLVLPMVALSGVLVALLAWVG